MSQIVISYRREDSADITGRIYDHLVHRFGRENVFKDVDAIPPGADFRNEIASAVSRASVFLAVIGDRWLCTTDEEGRRRLDDPNDFVRIEIETALKRDLRLIPLLVRGARMPSGAELPGTLEVLTYRNGVVIREDPDFGRDMSRLIESIAEVLDQLPKVESEAGSGTAETSVTVQSRLMSCSIREIQEQMKGRLCGQQIAVDTVMPWVKRLRFGLPRDGSPAVTFLFVGRSGVGKTLLAKELARVIYGDEDHLIIFEMGQYRSPEAMTMLIGAPSGFLGSDQGRLTNALRDSPTRVLFFDEIEKAHPTALDLILRFIDSGFVQDAGGPIRDGRQAVVILATSAGHIESSGAYEPHDSANINQEMSESARAILPKELSARVDEIVCLVPLSKAACRKIVDTAIDRDILRLLNAQGIRVSVTEAVRTNIVEEFHSLSLHEGARAAPRIVHKLLTLAIIDFSLTGQTSASGAQSRTLEARLDKDGKIVIRATEEEKN